MLIVPKTAHLGLVGQGVVRRVRTMPVASWVELQVLAGGLLVGRDIELMVGAVGIAGPPSAVQSTAINECPPCAGVCACGD